VASTFALDLCRILARHVVITAVTRPRQQVHDVVDQDAFEVATVANQDPVEAFGRPGGHDPRWIVAAPPQLKLATVPAQGGHLGR
jgi:hypothetical protein